MKIACVFHAEIHCATTVSANLTPISPNSPKKGRNRIRGSDTRAPPGQPRGQHSWQTLGRPDLPPAAHSVPTPAWRPGPYPVTRPAACHWHPAGACTLAQLGYPVLTANADAGTACHRHPVLVPRIGSHAPRGWISAPPQRATGTRLGLPTSRPTGRISDSCLWRNAEADSVPPAPSSGAL